ncbi:MAG: hypothetical protein HQL54_10795 [Magnetococcales bacterium]|nr:hypothetical protein [Magnetococcales bacterium]
MSDPRLDDILEDLVKRAAREYRMDADAIQQIFSDVFANSTELTKALQKNPTPRQLRKNPHLKKAAQAARKKIYYQLRQYRPKTTGLTEKHTEHPPILAKNASQQEAEQWLKDIINTHISTQERRIEQSHPLESIINRHPTPRSIVDVGCGVHPLQALHHLPENCISHYTALDRDRWSIEALKHYADWRNDGLLSAHVWDLSSGWQNISDLIDDNLYDLALIQKLIPVISRRNDALLETLAQIPARRAIVTGSRMAMVRRKQIHKRELGIIQRFLEQANWTIEQQIQTEDEVGWLVRTDQEKGSIS